MFFLNDCVVTTTYCYYCCRGCSERMPLVDSLFIADAHFINLQISSMMDKWFGESQKRVEAIFSLVNSKNNN